jgi:predicted transcriptional regulator
MPAMTIRTSLGPLERQAMNLVWELEECCVASIVKRLQHPRAYTTIMTTLTRLYHKGLLNRRWADGKFLYSARLSHQQLEEAVDQELITQVLRRPAPSRDAIIASLLQASQTRNSKRFTKTARSSRVKAAVEQSGKLRTRFARGRFER